MKKDRRGKRYSEAFKRQIVRDLERGVITASEVRKKYGVSGGNTIEYWLKRYGTGKVSPKTRKRKDVAASRKLLVYERRTRELEQAVARLTVEKVALESLIDEAQTELGIDLKKTFGQGR
jgi:transposase-like protein